MRPVKLLVVAAFAILAFGAVGTAVASAETPEILCLVIGCVKALEGEFLTHEAEKFTFETLGGLKIAAEDAHVKIEKCEALEGTEEKDANLCKDQLAVFTGVLEPSKKSPARPAARPQAKSKFYLTCTLRPRKRQKECYNRCCWRKC